MCNFCIFNDCSLSTICVTVYCDVVNVQPRFRNFSNEIITEVILNLDSSVNFAWVRHEAGW